jgi:ubiquinone biosynthesis protein COQ9
MNAPLGAKLLYRTVDTMWRTAGDTSTDFNFYTKRAILAGVYSSTMMRWFNDKSDDAAATREFLSARIENVMQFERLKAEVRERTKDLPSFADILKGFSAPRS